MISLIGVALFLLLSIACADSSQGPSPTPTPSPTPSPTPTPTPTPAPPPTPTPVPLVHVSGHVLDYQTAVGAGGVTIQFTRSSAVPSAGPIVVTAAAGAYALTLPADTYSAGVATAASGTGFLGMAEAIGAERVVDFLVNGATASSGTGRCSTP